MTEGLSREKQVISAAAMLDFCSVFMIGNAESNYFFHHCCTSSPGCNIGTWMFLVKSTAPSLPTDPRLHPSYLTILCASWSSFWHCCKTSCKRDNLWNWNYPIQCLSQSLLSNAYISKQDQIPHGKSLMHCLYFVTPTIFYLNILYPMHWFVVTNIHNL